MGESEDILHSTESFVFIKIDFIELKEKRNTKVILFNISLKKTIFVNSHTNISTWNNEVEMPVRITQSGLKLIQSPPSIVVRIAPFLSLNGRIVLGEISAT